MNKLESLHKAVSTFDVKTIINEVLKISEIQQALIDIIQTRLYDKGTTAEGEKLRTDHGKSSWHGGKYGFYCKNTEVIKQRHKSPKQPIDRVTLKDTGEFYESFKTTFKTDLDVSADFRDIYLNFQDSFNSENEFEQAILDISDEEKEILFDKMWPIIEEKTLQWLAIA
jgi:hypothetical protein